MKVVQTNNAPQAIGPYSQGIIVNNMFYSSGQIPLTASGEPCSRRRNSTNRASISKFTSSIRRSRCFI